ncbi:hypothetical protein [[Eubacterium] hominis]|uniref:hypothetical protein n=1 Tax=[Eubacterium] hominis TaxID=2764325 RepID=UPI0022DFB8DE
MEKQKIEVIKALNTIKNYCHNCNGCHGCILKEGCSNFELFTPMDIEIPSLVPELSTLEEECLKYYLDKGYKWITRDEGEVTCWKDKPYRDKENNDILLPSGSINYIDSNDMFNDLFTFIEDKDTEPWKIEYILGISEEIE